MPALDVCDCGRVIEQPATGRRRSKCLVCSPKDKRDRRRGVVTALPTPPTGPGGAVPVDGALVEATREELGDLAGTADGLAVLQLARAIDAGGAPGAGLPSLVKQFTASKAALLATGERSKGAQVIEALFGTSRA